MFESKSGRARTQNQMTAHFAGQRPGALFGNLRRVSGGFGDTGGSSPGFSSPSSSSPGSSSPGSSSPGSSSPGSVGGGGVSVPHGSSGPSAGQVFNALTQGAAIAANVTNQVLGGKKPTHIKHRKTSGLSGLVTTLTKNPLYLIVGVVALGAGFYLLKSGPTIVVAKS